MRIEAEVPTDLLRPLKRLIDSARAQHHADLEALAQAYGRRTEAGVEELALALAPRSLLGDHPSQLTLDVRCVKPRARQGM